jgi:hypothetical protein
MKFKRIKKERTMTLSKAGSIRIGMKQEGKNYPTSLDYFLAKSDFAQYVDDFNKAYPSKPNMLRIYFLSDDIAEVCPNIYELRDSSGKLIARGDGEAFQVVVVDKFGKGSFEDWTLERIQSKGLTPDQFMQGLEKKYGSKWREVLRLRFMIANVNLLGYWELTTHATASSIPQIINCLDRVLLGAGRIVGIPFDLCVKKVKSDKSGVKSQYPVLSLICNFSEQAKEQALELQKSLVENVPLLASPEE